MSKSSTFSRSPWSPEKVHGLNGQLLEFVTAFLSREIKWNPKHWIANVLVLERSIDDELHIKLRTSATLFRGEPFYSNEKCKPGGPVLGLGNEVPLKGSYAGYCVRRGQIVWISDMASIDPRDPLHKQYRPWGPVLVTERARPAAEYVFPIRTIMGLSQSILGVLNLECYQQDAKELADLETKRNFICASIMKILDHHAPILYLTTYLRKDGPDPHLEKFHRQFMRAASDAPKARPLAEE